MVDNMGSFDKFPENSENICFFCISWLTNEWIWVSTHFTENINMSKKCSDKTVKRDGIDNWFIVEIQEITLTFPSM